MRNLFARAIPAALIATALPVSAAVLDYNENTDGDLSDVFGAPTALTLGLGANTITGIVGTGSGGATNGTDADYFGFALSAGQSVDSILFTRTGSTSQSFFGYKADTAFAGQGNEDIDGFVLFSDGLEAVASLPAIGAGNHAFWVQETGGTVAYSVTFNVVPEPASLTAVSAAGLLLLRRRKA